MTTPTPRTDEAIEGMSFAWRNTAPIVELARQLERELATAKGRSKVMEDWAKQEAALRDAAETERDALRRDAERYRFLCDETGKISPVAAVFWKLNMNRRSSDWETTVSPQSLNAAIDAAMKEKP